jgi:hypothetical protein
MFGHGGNDTLFGQAGDDLMFGHDGNDTLYGGAGGSIGDFQGKTNINFGDGGDGGNGGAARGSGRSGDSGDSGDACADADEDNDC